MVAIDAKKNTITVSSSPKDAERSRVSVIDTHWIGEPPQAGRTYDAEVRYHQKPQKARVRTDNKGTHINFDDPQLVAAGQSVVIYDGDVCLGGGIACV